MTALPASTSKLALLREATDVTACNNWRRRSITILCLILVCFFSSKWAEFLRVVSNCSENHSPVFFSLVFASFSSRNVCKKQVAMGRFADFIFRENKRFLLLAVQQQTAKSAAEFFCIQFDWKTKHKPAEKNTGLWLSIKSETTCKNSAHLDEKKKTDQNSTWLCCDVFNYYNSQKIHTIGFTSASVHP